MISVNRAVPKGLQRSYAARNGSTAGFHALASTQGGAGKKHAEIESAWLIVKGGSGKGLNEQWGTYLATKGFTTGSLEERMRAFFATGTQA
jgi:hypothetical protein